MTTPVTPATESKLRNAMERLLSGQPTRTDGRLTKANLHIEADVSRATMNRATAVMKDWDSAVKTDATPRSRRVSELEATVTQLKTIMARLRQSNTELERKNQAAATVIAELSTQLAACRDDQPGTVTLLLNRKGHRPKTRGHR